MNCADVRTGLLDAQRGRLPADAERELRAHLAGCVDCAHAEAVEAELTAALEERLPQHPASLALKRRLADRWRPGAPAASRRSRWRRILVPALAAAAAVLLALSAVYYEREAAGEARARAVLVAEAVNDHLRVISSQHPLDIESGGIHQVKPWFEGRLDFAPVVPFEGDGEFLLRGGAVGYFLDRKAAVLLYTRRLHPITLLVFRAAGLAWPPRGVPSAGVGDAAASAERGFTVLMWRRGDLGYALVSDVDPAELRTLAAKLGA